MLISLDYDGTRATAEIDSLRAANPGYQVNTARADASAGNVSLSLPELKAEWTIPVRASQVGLFINVSAMLTPAQVRYLQKLGQRASEAFVLKIPAESTFISSRVIESYKADAAVCSRISGTNMRSVITGLADFAKPPEIRNSQTFDDLRKQILDRCFALPTATGPIASWSALLDTSVDRVRDPQAITAQYSQRSYVRKQHTVSPVISVSIN